MAKFMNEMSSPEKQATIADEYLSAARVLMNAGPKTSRSLPVMFLLAHALELLLKAYVKLMAPADTKKYRHDINLLWKRSKSFGLFRGEATSLAEVDVVVNYMKAGHEEYQFRYFDKSFSYTGPIMTEESIKKVREAVWGELTKLRQKKMDDAERRGLRFAQILVGVRISIELA